MDIYRNYGDGMDFHVHDGSSFDEVGEAVLVCAFAASGYGGTTEAHQKDAHQIGPSLLLHADQKFGRGASSKISAAITATMVIVAATLQQRKGQRDAQARGLIDEAFNG
jgi:hypothetical protein